MKTTRNCVPCFYNSTSYIFHELRDDAEAQTSLYKPRTSNKIKFYSDAYDTDAKTSGTFNDIFQAMDAAEDTILIAGWTLSPREKFSFSKDGIKQKTTLPQLLAKKAFKGTSIVLLLWKNISPRFHEDTNTLVKTIKAEIKKIVAHELRQGSYTKKDFQLRCKEIFSRIHMRYTRAHLTYTDHAKMIITDSRTLFLGGLDLTRDRSQIKTWHDVHCCVEGPAVIDAIDLFAKRFKRHAKVKEKYMPGLQVLKQAQDKANENYCEDNLVANPLQPTIQLLTALRKEYIDASDMNFAWEKDTHTTELSTSQVQAIKAAQDFIYMENQFFLGPRFSAGKSVEGKNNIILAIFNKLKEKIAEGKAFHFYCQLPYHPEGKAKDLIVKLLLHNQWKTIEWLIKKLQVEIAKYNFEHPNNLKTVGDYVTFSNLGFYPSENNDRFKMKYTHSKLMIVDDKTAFIGSNNCNERSSTGSRDHEVCLRVENYPEIGMYRKQLMKQHFGKAMQYIKDLQPHDKVFYTTIKNHLNSNLIKKPLTICSTPWGNIKTTRLERAEKPEHIQGKIDKSISFIQCIIPASQKLLR